MTTIQTTLIDKLSPILEGLGYELVHLEMQTHQGKTLRVYIDHASPREIAPAKLDPIGVEDCAKVSRALDEPLEAMPELDKAFGGAYELEISSPGVDRPLRKVRDFEKFSGRDARIHTFRPLTADELGNADYQKRNPKQKNFLGRLSGVIVRDAAGMKSDENVAVRLTVLASMGSTTKKKGAKPGKNKEPERADEILLPMSLISKANIEPNYDFS
ncbi:MAG: ribosome maturation factor RimP [Bdellovibrionales bacterium]|nr:ribosome maturation factor RimP [Bdellovibrionales bacterium]